MEAQKDAGDYSYRSACLNARPMWRAQSKNSSSGGPRLHYAKEMRSIKAFVAKSFDPRDEPKTRQVEGILNSFRPLGVQWETAEPAEIESVSEKVRRKIDECDLFVGIFTRRHPIYDQTTADLRHPTANQPVAWTGPPWLFQESGYALKAGKKLMLFLENQVEFPMLTGDLEYIPLNSELPAGALKKAAEVLSDLIAQTAGIELRTLVSGPATNTVIGDATSGEQPLVVEITRPPSLRACIEELIEAEFDKDESSMDRAEGEGLEVIRSGMAEAVDELYSRFFVSKNYLEVFVPDVPRKNGRHNSTAKATFAFDRASESARAFGGSG